VDAISNWMTQNFLKLNHNKTKAILIATPVMLKKRKHSQLSIPGFFTNTTSEVKNLGAIIDSTISSHKKLHQNSFLSPQKHFQTPPLT
jgi:hypothetical protein